MSWQTDALQQFKLYAVTDLKEASDEIFRKVDAAYEGGADIIQLRSKNLTDRELYKVGKGIRDIAHKYQKLFFVNDRVDLALALGADGVHVGQEDMPIEVIRELAEKASLPLLIGKSTHSLEQALRTAEELPDYIGVGPIYGTPTKPDYIPVGCDLIKQVAGHVKVPFVAIGGINENNLDEVLRSGAVRVAVVRAIFSAEDVYESTKRIAERIQNFDGQYA